MTLVSLPIDYDAIRDVIAGVLQDQSLARQPLFRILQSLQGELRGEVESIIDVYEIHAVRRAKPLPLSRQLGDAPFSIATRNGIKVVEALWRRFDLPPYRDCLGRGNWSLEKMKPHPEHLLELCRRARVLPSETVFYGNATEDAVAGYDAGIETVLV